MQHRAIEISYNWLPDAILVSLALSNGQALAFVYYQVHPTVTRYRSRFDRGAHSFKERFYKVLEPNWIEIINIINLM